MMEDVCVSSLGEAADRVLVGARFQHSAGRQYDVHSKQVVLKGIRVQAVTDRPLPVSVYVIAYNDEPNMRACLESVAGWADEVIVVDSHSTDRTAAIAAEFTDKVYQVEFTGFGALRNQAVARCSHEWIFSLDTDERMTR